MKKALGILSVLVLITVMMISCNAEQKLDDTVGVSFNVSSSRALTVENDNFVSVDSKDLTWYYHGVKRSDTQFIFGQSASMDKNNNGYWTEISTGDELSAKPVTFSQGQWFFEIKAMKDNTQMYYGKTNGNVLLTKENRTISISVSPFVSGVNGTLVLSNVYIAPQNSNEKVEPNRLYINGEPIDITESYIEDGKAYKVDYEGGKAINYTCNVAPGTYTVEVKRVGEEDNGVVLASASKTVVVYSGLTTTIKGSVEEDTTSGTFDPQPIRPSGSEDISISQAGDTVVKFVNVTPSMEADKSTTVTFETGALPSDATKAVTEVKTIEEAKSANFNVTDGLVAVASINLKITDDEGILKAIQTGKTVTVETYILKGLSSVKVKYNGEGDQPIATDSEEATDKTVAASLTEDDGISLGYNKTTGLLRFKTNHFSDFYVTSSASCYIVETNTAYAGLSSAISKVEDGQTIKAIKDLSSVFASGITINNDKSFVIDLNGNNYDSCFTIKRCDVTIKNGSISGNNQQPFVVYSSNEDCQYNSITIEDNVEIIGNGSYGIVIYPTNSSDVGYGTIVNLNGTIDNVESGIFVLGTITNTIDDSQYPIEIYVGDKAKIKSFAGGIHENGTAIVTVEEGAEFECVDTAIEVRSGHLIINGGSFVSTADSFSCGPNGSGSTTSGAAIAIAQHTTKKDINVTINGGTFTGIKALNESNPQENNPAPQVELIVSGGIFNGDVSVIDIDEFIYGGTFSSNPSEYIGDYSFASDNGNGTYTVSSLTVDEEGTYLINNVKDLVLFEKLVNERGNTFIGKTVQLTDDIDLSNITWTPIGTNADGANKFKGIFDGQGHTISNMTVNQGVAYHAAGFFGALNGTAKNIIFDNATVTSISAPNAGGNTDNGTAVVAGSIYTSGSIVGVTVNNSRVSGNRYVGGISGYTYGSVRNCTVKYTTITSTPDNLMGAYDNGDKIGGVVGYLGESSNSVSDCTLENNNITGYRDIGGIVGYTNGTVNENKIFGGTLTVDNLHNYKNYSQASDHDVNAIVGEAAIAENVSDNIEESTVTIILPSYSE